MVKKILVEPTELFEYGVYNSETDIATNPKTGENIPNDLTTIADMILDRLTDSIDGIEEVILFIKDNTKLSHEVLDSCIKELKGYKTDLENEKKSSLSNIIN